jgi:dsDNA-specific endonuclease/ATPase MutS2
VPSSLWQRVRDWLFGTRAHAVVASEPEPEVEPSDEVLVVPIEASIDLHHFAPRDIPSVVDEYLREAAEKGLTEVRVIHGRGKGVQRQRVQKQLSRHPLVIEFRSDGLGSTLATLRPPRRKRPS